MKKEWFMLFRYPVPADLEYYLEEQASLGYYLEPLGEKGMFYYTFKEAKSGKCKYMVDVSKLPKSMYIETLMSKGWTYLGTSGNCYVWKQEYVDERPEDMSDKLCKYKHCRNGAILSAIGMLVFLIAAIALIWGTYVELTYGGHIKHHIYIFEAVINFFVSGVCLAIYRKFSRGISIYK